MQTLLIKNKNLLYDPLDLIEILILLIGTIVRLDISIGPLLRVGEVDVTN